MPHDRSPAARPFAVHVLAAAAAAALAPAATQAQSTGTTASTGQALQQIEVTAQRRTQKLQDVPLAATAILESDLELRGITKIYGEGPTALAALAGVVRVRAPTEDVAGLWQALHELPLFAHTTRLRASWWCRCAQWSRASRREKEKDRRPEGSPV